MPENTKSFEETPGYKAIKNEIENILDDEAGITLASSSLIQLLENGAHDLQDHQLKKVYGILHLFTTLQASARLNRLNT